MKTYISKFSPVILPVLAICLLSGNLSAQVTKSFSVKKGETLSVKVVGEVLIKTSGKDEVIVKTSGIETEDLEKLEISQIEKGVSVVFTPKSNSNSNTKFEIQIPEQFNVNIKTAGGEIACVGLLKGNFEAKTAGGNISVSNIEGELQLKTAGGGINTGDITGSASLSTAGGDIKIGNVSGKAELVTAGGDVETKDVSKSLTVKTAGGSISLGNIGENLKASTSGGNIKLLSSAGDAVLSTSGGDITVHNSKGNITLSTSGGNIEIKKAEAAVTAHSSAGEIEVAFISEPKQESKLSADAGNVKLKFGDKARATVEVINNGHSKYNGADVKSEFGGPTQNSKDSKHSTYQINGGGKSISVKANLGNVKILKLK